MLSEKQIIHVQKIYLLRPEVQQKKPLAVVCFHCAYVNEIEFAFCINCGFPLQNKLLTDAFDKRIQQRRNLLFKAENSVMISRMVLYIIASFLSIGVFFIFAESDGKYIVVLLALLLSALFFFLAFWSRKNPFSALLTAFIILIAFSAINIFNSFTQSVPTLTGLTGMLICLALLFVILKGIHAAYRIILIKEELQVER